ncbi:MAG: hypothetical protein EOS55_06585 [Mesorhizobium sp.]|nr:MAG: hypothetical protein EOS55_06585 [Mesorhizobium sp.]
MDDKARIVAERLEPNPIISEVARRYGLRPQQVFARRREARKQAASVLQESPAYCRRWRRRRLRNPRRRVQRAAAEAEGDPRRWRDRA